jgi:signal transduction histidine kinase
MRNHITCPECNHPLTKQVIHCQSCGAKLQLVAISRKDTLLTPPDDGEEQPLSLEVLVPRLGDYLISNEYLTPEELDSAIAYQKEKQQKGESILIGQAVLELGLIEKSTLDKAITEQILQLQSALQQMNQTLEKRVKQRTKELEKALARLSELNELKSNFIANVSHELRTPITHLRGYLELLKDESLGPLNDKQQEALATMEKSESKLEELIESLIQFSHFEQSNLELNIQEFNLKKLLKKAVSLAQAKCKKKSLSCVISMPPLIPNTRGDEQRLYWVFHHLIDNAVKFTPKNGRVEIGAKVNEKEILLYVSDTGIGISQDKIQEIFEPFHQLDSSSTRQYGGTGLGLSLVKRIIETHGSSIRIKSRKGKGTHIAFTLPVVSD